MRRSPSSPANDPFGLFLVSGATDGTTNPQTLGGGGFNLIDSLGLNAYPAEPKTAAALGLFTLDQLSRAVLTAWKTGGTGSWALAIEMSRNAGSNWTAVTRLALAAIPSRAAALPQVIENPFPADFMRTLGVDVNDVVSVRARVTPGQAAAQTVAVVLSLQPGPGSGFGGDRGRIYG
jgi:hypothetical protein